MRDLKAIREEIKEMGLQTVALSGIELADASDLQREILAAFIFGLVFPVYKMAALTAPEGHALTLLYLQDVLRYDPKKAAEVADTMIRASLDASYHDTVHAIIHRGIDGHATWENGRKTRVADNIQSVLDHLKAR